MSFKYRLPTRTQLSEHKLKTMLANTRRAIAETQDEGIRGIMANAYTALKDFITTLGKPLFIHEDYRMDDEISLKRYNTTRRTISDDLDAARLEVGAMTRSANEVFNTTSVLARDLESRAGVASSRSQDLQIINTKGIVDTLVAGDDFSNTSHINYRRSLSSAMAYIDINQGVVTLARESNEDVITPDAIVTVTPIKPEGVLTGPTTENLGRFYEGKFYGIAGEAEPEGGRWHLEELPLKQTEGSFEHITINESGKRNTNVTIEHGQKIGVFEMDDEGNLKNDIIIRDRGATEAEKQNVRKRMIDGNPDTYWRCEYVFRPSDFNPLLTAKDLRADPGLSASAFPLPNSKEYFELLNAGQFEGRYGSIKGSSFSDLLPDSASPGVYSSSSEITPEDLRVNALRYDEYNLEVEIVIELPEPRKLNWLHLNPMNFGETTWLKITKLEVAPTRNGEWTQIPGFDRNQFANTLTDDANAELSSNTQEYVMSPSRFAYRGTGVWTFPARMVQKIRFCLRQEVPVPDLYQRIHVQMCKTEEARYQHNYSGSSGQSVSSWNQTIESARVLKLQYLQTLMIFQGTQINNYAQETDPVSGNRDFSAEWEGGTNFFDSPWGGLLNVGAGTKRSSSTSIADADTGWHVTRYWVETYYDILSYQIGIKDISAFSNQYTDKSEFITNEFISPKPLEKVALQVDHVIPAGSDIKYYISVNGGEIWLQINPLDILSRYDEGGQPIPRIITFNLPGDPPAEHKYVSTEKPVRTVMLKVELSSNNIDLSPVLKGYRLLMYPKSGLQALDEIV